MKKAERLKLDAALDKALAPPRRQDRKALDSLLADYEEPAPAVQPPAPVVSALAAAPPPDVAPPRDVAATSDGAATQEGQLLLHQIAATPDVAPPPDVDPRRFTRFPNDIFDKVLLTLKPIEQLVLLRIYRLSRGFNKDRCVVSVGKLAKHCNAGTTATRNATFALEARGLIRRLAVDQANSEQAARGVEFQIMLPAAEATPGGAATPRGGATRDVAATRGVANKEKHLKQNYIKGETPKIIRLTPEEISEFVATVRDLVNDGRPLEQVTEQFAPSLHPDDWSAIQREITTG